MYVLLKVSQKNQIPLPDKNYKHKHCTGKGRNSLLPVSEDIQHSLCGGEGAVGGEEDGDEGGVSHRKGVEEVEHQLLFCPRFNTLGARNS